MGVVIGLPDLVGCGNLRPRERNIIYRSSLAKIWCPLARNQLSVAPASPCQRSFYLLCSIASTAFVFSSSWTVPLYASLRGLPMTTAKRRRRRSFKMLIAASVAITVVLVLPLCDSLTTFTPHTAFSRPSSSRPDLPAQCPWNPPPTMIM